MTHRTQSTLSFAGALLAASALAAPARAQSAPPPLPPPPPGTSQPASRGVTLGVSAGARLGNTTFALKHGEYVADVGSVVTAESRLNWPADFLMVGGHGRWAPGGRYTLTFAVATNAHAPVGEMDDSDWIAAPDAGVSRTKFAYTESRTEARALVADLGLRVRQGARWQLLGGYHHEYYRGEAWGADGWVDDGSGRTSVGIDGDVLGIVFESHRLMPYLGARLRDRYEGRLIAVYTHDHDDHVLRGKEGTGRSVGVGLLLAARPRWQLGGRTVGVDLELQYVRAHWGTLGQHYYADDPSTADDERAIRIPDSDYLAASLHAGAMFVAELGL